MRIPAFAVLVALLAVLGGCSMAGPIALAGATTPVALTQTTVVSEINATRQHYGARPLSYSGRLEAIARKQSLLMASRGKMSHELGGNLHDRTTSGGYDGATGENLAVGQKTLEVALADWLKSPGHKSTLLNSRWVEFGLAASVAPNGRTYWTFVAGGPFANWR
jgi:uncharacterized protein YkwD